MLKDLEVNRQARECPYTVTFMGALCREGEVLICMELMETSLHQYYTDAHKYQLGMPEPVLGKQISGVVRSFLADVFVSQVSQDWPDINIRTMTLFSK